MELRHIRYFLAVAETLNFRRAAEQLGISQPPLSTQIRQLEDELGVRLFERSSDGTFLTGPGHVFYDHALTILDGVDSALRDVRQAAGAKIGKLRVGWTSAGDFTSFLPQAVHQFRIEYPGVSITLNEMVSFKQLIAVSEGKLDVGIARRPERNLDDTLEVTEIWSDRLVLAMRPEHPLAEREDVSIEDFKNEKIVACTSDSGIGINHVLRQMFSERGLTPNVVQECNSTFVLGLVVAGLGVAVVPSTLRIPELRFIPISAPDALCPLCTISRRNNRDPLVKLFRDTVMRFAGDAETSSLVGHKSDAASAPPVVRSTRQNKQPSNRKQQRKMIAKGQGSTRVIAR
jgi:DNA-binding transcriptional LysR family regulator